MSLLPKRPEKVRAGKAGAVARWGAVPRHVVIRDLPPESRALIVALANAVRSAVTRTARTDGEADQ